MRFDAPSRMQGSTPARVAIAIVLAHLAFFVISRIEPPKVDSDASTGLLVWRSMERGSHWNESLEPDPADIARDHSVFLSWWSPGQYLAVAPLRLLGMSWGAAISVATLCCSLAGLLGYWRLYLQLGFEREAAGWATAILAFTWHLTRSYGEFPGGEVPLFAVAPWLMAAILRQWRIGPRGVATFAAAYVIGALAKLSFCVAALATLAGIVCVEMGGARTRLKRGLLLAWAALAVACGQLALWGLFLRHGSNPSTLGGHGQPWWYVLPSALVLPVGSILGVGTLLGRVFLFPGHPLVQSPQELAPLLWVLAVGSLGLVAALWHADGLPKGYRSFALAMAGTYVAVLGLLILRGASISLEDRQFFPAGAVLLPGLVLLVRQAPSRRARHAAFGIFGATSAYALLGTVVHARQLYRMHNVGRAGFTQHMLSPGALELVHALDRRAPEPARGTLVYVPSPEMSFEMQRVRTLSTFDLFASAEDITTRVRHGRVPLLVVLSNPVLEAGGRGDLVRRSFVDYAPSEWKTLSVDGWTFYYQGEWPRDLSAPAPVSERGKSPRADAREIASRGVPRAIPGVRPRFGPFFSCLRYPARSASYHAQ